MRPAGYCLMAVLFLSGSLVAQMPDNQSEAGFGRRATESLRPQPVADSCAQVAQMDRMIVDMQDLVKQDLLNPRQRAEINALINQVRTLRQQVGDPPESVQQFRHQRQWQEILRQLNVIKNQLPLRPANIKKYPIVIVLSSAPLFEYLPKYLGRQFQGV